MKRMLLCAGLLLWSGICAATVYKWVDSQGKVQYGDRPPDGVKAELVALLGTHTPITTTPAPVASNTTPASTPATAQDDTKKTVENDVAATKAKQCSEAQDRYKKLIEGRRLYRTGKDGEREYLSSQEIDSERIGAKTDVDTICGSST